MKTLLSFSDLKVMVCFITATTQATMSSSKLPDSIARFSPTCLTASGAVDEHHERALADLLDADLVADRQPHPTLDRRDTEP